MYLKHNLHPGPFTQQSTVYYSAVYSTVSVELAAVQYSLTEATLLAPPL